MKSDRLRWVIAVVLTFGLIVPECRGQGQIVGRIALDTTRWTPVAYLSLIPDFTQLYSISNESIIRKSAVNSEGLFSLDCRNLPPGDHVYRLHFSKKGDPAAALIIGGQDENHIFLIADTNSIIKIRIAGGLQLMSGISVAGYAPNRALLEINQIAGFLDTLDYYGPSVNRDFVRQAVYDKLRQYADTCRHPLISLYALYHSRFESNYPGNVIFYDKYLRKWKKENSEYFRAFRAQLPEKEPADFTWLFFVGFALFVLGPGITVYSRRRRKPEMNPLQTLTVQERKIFSLLKEGRSNKEISEECGISLSTVKSHVNNIYSKLKISSRTGVMDYNGSNTT